MAEAAPDGCDPAVACRLDAFTKSERALHQKRLAEVAALSAGGHELADGYAFEVRAKGAKLANVLEWIALERRCCPFLEFDLAWPANGAPPTLSVRGPAEAKALILATLAGERSER